MKIAFTSCMSTKVFPSQPVWDQIALRHPDRLLLLGDSIYIDGPPFPIHPKTMETEDFRARLFALYKELINQPQFKALVQSIPTDAIWDDHDFLWNECYREKAIGRVEYKDHVQISRLMFNAYRHALGAQLSPGSFPASAPALGKAPAPEPGYQSRILPGNVVLHLTDGRSFRIKKDLFGKDQRQAIEAKFAAAPDAAHILASGSVVTGTSGGDWKKFDDYEWLMKMARQYKILVLSGDIHKNAYGSVDLGGGKWLHEGTASGAAIRKAISIGSECQNFGLCGITAEAIRLDFFSFGTPDSVGSYAINRATWESVSAP